MEFWIIQSLNALSFAMLLFILCAGLSLIFGVLSVLGGIYAFVNPLLAGLAMPILIGIFFLIQGMNTITTGLYMIKEDRLDEKD